MPTPVTLSIAAALTVAGAGMGLYLGNGVAGQLGPVGGAATGGSSFYADRVAAPPDWGQPAPLSGPAPAAVACVNCATYPEEYYPRADLRLAALYAGDADIESPLYEPEPDLAAIEAEPAPQPSADDCAIADQCAGDPTPGV